MIKISFIWILAYSTLRLTKSLTPWFFQTAIFHAGKNEFVNFFKDLLFIFIMKVFGGDNFVFKFWEENNYLCRCVRVGWGRFRASTRLVKWSHYQARARADTPGKCRLFKGRKHYTIYFLSKNQKDSVKSQKDSVSPRFSEKTQKMHTIIFSCNQMTLESFNNNHSTQNRKLHQTVVTVCFTDIFYYYLFF